MQTLAGIEGKGRVTLLPRPGGLPGYVGQLFLDLSYWRRVVELLKVGDPVTYVGPAHTKTGMKTVTLNVRITKVHTPSMSGVPVDFVSTGAPLSETDANE